MMVPMPARIEAAFPYVDDLLALPVADLDQASDFYERTFGLTPVRRIASPPTVIMERDGVQFGFAINGKDPSQDGAAILVDDLSAFRAEVEASGLKVGANQTDERDGKTYQAFFIVAPDGLCYYVHQLVK